VTLTLSRESSHDSRLTGYMAPLYGCNDPLRGPLVLARGSELSGGIVKVPYFLVIPRRREARSADYYLRLLGPPAAGTSRLARRLTTILPEMTLAEALDTTRIHSVAGLTGGRTTFVTKGPFRAPHHTISDVGLIGGGQVPMPGEVSLAHHRKLLLGALLEVLC
jgi:Magnesium chelatase, subunit ChlI